MSRAANPLSDPVRYLPGVGPRKSELLKRLGITTVGTLLLHRPRRYLDRRQAEPIASLLAEQDCTLVAHVVRADLRRDRRGGTRIEAQIADRSGAIQVVWFGAPYLLRQLKPGATLLLSGRVRWHRRLQLVNPEFEIQEEDSARPSLVGGRILPVYPSTAGLTQRTIRAAVQAASDRIGETLADPIPSDLRRRLSLPSRAEAVRWLHFPDELTQAEEARRRFAFEELFCHQLFLHRLRRLREDPAGAAVLRLDRNVVEAMQGGLGFRLTGAQQRAVEEILGDLAGGRPMNRLLQGDVGSGKTVVAAFACLAASKSGRQSSVLAPTEILTYQHAETLTRFLGRHGVRVDRLTGGMPSTQRKQILARLASGEIDLLVGTHALLESDVQFKDLALIVVDEQQRFGVYQRSRFRQKGTAPHILVMSATPIPRTLAMTIYGDLDTTLLDEVPPGRIKVRTRIVDRSRWDDLLRFIADRLRDGDQAFFVYPLIEESSAIELRDATRMWQSITHHEAFGGLRIGLLHGRTPSAEREETIDAMRAGRLHALVATTVIEVGLDLPRATLMVIEHPDRFGLSQLHQLRGRIGRAPGHPPYLFLMRPESESGAGERLEVLVREQDGFRVAEEDLRLRGPGDLLGRRQTGLPELRFTDLATDRSLIEKARGEVVRLLETDPDLQEPRHRAIWEEVVARYPEGQAFFGVG